MRVAGDDFGPLCHFSLLIMLYRIACLSASVLTNLHIAGWAVAFCLSIFLSVIPIGQVPVSIPIFLCVPPHLFASLCPIFVFLHIRLLLTCSLVNCLNHADKDHLDEGWAFVWQTLAKQCCKSILTDNGQSRNPGKKWYEMTEYRRQIMMEIG